MKLRIYLSDHAICLHKRLNQHKYKLSVHNYTFPVIELLFVSSIQESILLFGIQQMKAGFNRFEQHYYEEWNPNAPEEDARHSNTKSIDVEVAFVANNVHVVIDSGYSINIIAATQLRKMGT